MIEYKQLETGNPKDVQVATDDSAEMLALQELVNECEFEIELPADHDDDGMFRFTLPGGMVGEFSDVVYDIDGGLLEEDMERWNNEAIARAEAQSD